MTVVSIIGIGDAFPAPPVDIVEQQGDFRPGLTRSERKQIGQVAPVECDDMIEAIEVRARHLPRAQMRNVDAVAQGRRLRAPVGRITDMPVPRPGGIGLDIEPKTLRLGTERALRQRRATDISKTDEKNPDRHDASPGCQHAPLC